MNEQLVGAIIEALKEAKANQIERNALLREQNGLLGRIVELLESIECDTTRTAFVLEKEGGRQ